MKISKPYGTKSTFSALLPIIILLISYAIEIPFGNLLPENLHEGLVGIATIFTYGIIFLIPISYASFNFVILPILNWLPTKTRYQSYLINSSILLVMMGVILSCIFFTLVKKDGEDINWLQLIRITLIPIAFVAFNCMGHIYWVRCFSPVNNGMPIR